MDLYQIFIVHNRMWSVREIICFSIIFIVSAGIACLLWYRKKIVPIQAVAGLLLLLFLGIVFGSTVFTRQPNPYHEYELELFWSWKLVYQGSREMLKENLLNGVLLFPMGMLLPVVFYKKVPWWQGLLAGFFISAVIEVSQLIFCRGLFEWDDMIHNGVGCMVGCVIVSGVLYNRGE